MLGLLRLLVYLGLSVLSFLMASCAEHDSDPDRVSTIPWNRPEKWEGQGALGSFNPQGGYR